MKVHPMASGLRMALTITEARHVAQLLEQSGSAIAAPIVAAMRRGLVEVDAKGAAGRARKAAARAAKAVQPRSEGMEVDGYRVRATLGDYFDTGRDPDRPQWRRIRPDEPWQVVPTQTEIRRQWWMVYVFDADMQCLDGDGVLVEALDDAIPAARRMIGAAA